LLDFAVELAPELPGRIAAGKEPAALFAFVVGRLTVGGSNGGE
jgi:hypothetical protein